MNESQNKIGFFSPGAGALSIAYQFTKTYPGLNFTYYADTKYAPYGSRSAEEILNLAWQGIEKLLSMGCQSVVIGCNTSSTQIQGILQKLKDSAYGTATLIDIITPTVPYLAKVAKDGELAILATPAVVESNIFAQRLMQLKPELRVYQWAFPKLAQLIDHAAPKAAIENEILSGLTELFRKHPDIKTLALCCTHYPLVAEIFSGAANSLGKVNLQLVSQAEPLLIELEDEFKDQASFFHPSPHASREPAQIRLVASEQSAHLEGLFRKLFPERVIHLSYV